MKVSKLFFAAAIALFMGLSACSNDDDVTTSQEEGKGNTNVSVTLKLGQGSSLRSASDLPNDYNYIGEWAGKDSIGSVAIYLVDGKTVSVKTLIAKTDYTQTINAAKEVILTPQKAINTTPGIKKVYVVVNPRPEVTTALTTTNPTDFESAYKATVLNLPNSGSNTFKSTSADTLARKNGARHETILMTNVSEVIINVAPNVTEVQALDATNPQNRASVSVERAVARVMVTTVKTSYQINSGADVLGTLTNINWVLAQGENSIFIQRQTNWVTPSSAWVPTTATFASDAGSRYDYSGLFEGYNTTTKFGGTEVATMADYSTATVDKVTTELEQKLSGKFILPTTHTSGDIKTSNYKKGNTAYILIRAKFTPSASAYADGGTYIKDADFYVGANGKFYTSAENATKTTTGGIVGQTVAKYVGGKVLYYAWVNPNDLTDLSNSPVIRNNIYHVHITGFKNLGTNWNPLFPEDPNTTDPKNPDPKPSTTEPTNPIDPTDPLTTPETWMSVDVKVLPWKLHSYEVELGI